MRGLGVDWEEGLQSGYMSKEFKNQLGVILSLYSISRIIVVGFALDFSNPDPDLNSVRHGFHLL